MNSRDKGQRGERQWRDELRANGYAARRGQQFCGSPESPDVVCDDLPWVHFEVKLVERLNIVEAMEQARRDGGGKVPIVAHRRNFTPWLITMRAETFFDLLRGGLPSEPVNRTSGTSRTNRTMGGEEETLSEESVCSQPSTDQQPPTESE
ncbi:MAG: hypothetical protein HZA90_19095 [Verrucomicrobia bacterium]|nr:hypothetical protein [Verrucomicrobiota bacterium]